MTTHHIHTALQMVGLTTKNSSLYGPAIIHPADYSTRDLLRLGLLKQGVTIFIVTYMT